MGIIYNGPGIINHISDPYNEYHGSVGIERRGNSTQSFPKRPYLFETRDSLGNNLDVSLLGMPSDNDWILLASYIDRTFIRDPLAHYLSSQTGCWSSRSKFCELIVNNEYLGIYVLTEKIKRTKNRLNINKLTPAEISGEDITGGYIYEVTGFGGDFGNNRKLHYPKIDEIAQAQLEYIANYEDSYRVVMNLPAFNDTVNGYYKWIDANSFIDEILVQEVMRNSDAYGWSSYFHKDKNKKLFAGPVWDFDQSSGNSTYLEGGKTDGWIFDYGIDQPFFWKKLFYEPEFKSNLQLRWKDLRQNKFSTENIISFIDSCANYLNEAQVRNFEKWPILGVFIWRETSGYKNRNTYQKEIDYLKTYMINRLEWMDDQLKIIKTTNIAVINFSFEEPDSEKIKGWDGVCSDASWNGLLYDIPGWDSDSPAYDSGVEKSSQATNGNWIAFLMGRDTSYYQVTEYIIQNNDNIKLAVDVKNNYRASLLEVKMFYLDESETKIPIISEQFTVINEMTNYSLSFSAVNYPSAIGHKLGIEFNNVSPNSSSWIGLDNVTLQKSIPITSIKAQNISVDYSLFQNFPNPFNPSTKISYSLKEKSKVQMIVYDMLGREVDILVNQIQDAGNYSVNFSAAALSSGIYFYTLVTRNNLITKKMILLK